MRRVVVTIYSEIGFINLRWYIFQKFIFENGIVHTK